MDIETEKLSSVTAVVRCSGRLNMIAASGLKAHLDRTVDDGHRQVVVDLSGVAFIDSSGLGALIGGLKKARQSGGDLRLAGATEQVTEVLRLTNLDRVLRPYDSVENATSAW
ncbi:MAG: STAS domain-containing protein [Aeromicrobium sp.]